MIVGCYDLHLYCDGLDCARGQFRERAEYEVTAEAGSTCRAQARRAGWRLTKSQHALCPACVREGVAIDPRTF